jgi:predicted transcriptional regulator
MDKVFSTRIDESAAALVNSLARQLQSTKKQVVEQAIELFAAKVASEQKEGIWEQSFGAWNRDESPLDTVEAARTAFRGSFERVRR